MYLKFRFNRGSSIFSSDHMKKAQAPVWPSLSPSGPDTQRNSSDYVLLIDSFFFFLLKQKIISFHLLLDPRLRAPFAQAEHLSQLIAGHL